MPEGKKINYNHTSAHADSVKKYLVRFEDIKVRLPKGKRDYYKAAAARANMSLNSFVITAMDAYIEREGLDK